MHNDNTKTRRYVCPLPWKRGAALWVSLPLFAVAFAANTQPATGPTPAVVELRLWDYVRQVLAQNESLQIRMLDFEISSRRHASEWGAFEPDLVTSIERNSNLRENTAEQSSAQFGRSLFGETNNLYSAGLESLIPSGARIRLGYSLRDLHNTLQTSTLARSGEYQTFFGVNLTQPLLKNFGSAATLAGIRVAALNSEIAFQEYRRQLMVVVATAEAAYWNLFMAQEQVRALSNSVALAETILRDNQLRSQAGKGSELEILETQAGLALRRAKMTEARQKQLEALSQLVSLFQSSTILYAERLVAVDQPEIQAEPPPLLDGWLSVRELNPDYLAQLKRYGIEGVRLAYARNQRLPQIDFKTSYGFNGLGSSPSDSLDDVSRQDFPSWSVGVELRIPLGGGSRSRQEVAAARLSQEKALLSLRESETQVINALDGAIHKARSWRESIQSYRTIASFTQNVLDTQLARLEVGRVESRKVLEAEADLLQAKQGVVEAQVQYRRALLEAELAEGAVLKNRNLEFTQEELQTRTRRLASGARLNTAEYGAFQQEMPVNYLQHAVTNALTESEIRTRSERMLETPDPKQASPGTPPAPPTNPSPTPP